MKYSRLFLVGDKMLYSYSEELSPFNDGNWCLTLLLDEIESWKKTVKTIRVKKEDVPDLSNWISTNTLHGKPINKLMSLEGVEIPFSDIEIIKSKEVVYGEEIFTDYAKLRKK